MTVMEQKPEQPQGLVLTEEQKRQRGRRNVAIALSLGALAVLFWLITIFKLGGDVANRTM